MSTSGPERTTSQLSHAVLIHNMRKTAGYMYLTCLQLQGPLSHVYVFLENTTAQNFAHLHATACTP